MRDAKNLNHLGLSTPVLKSIIFSINDISYFKTLTAFLNRKAGENRPKTDTYVQVSENFPVKFTWT